MAASLFLPRASEAQADPQNSGGPPRSGSVKAEMHGEEIFSRFAGRILLLTCDVSAEESSQASGVLVSSDGFLVTNAHVVEGCRSMTATQIIMDRRRSYEAVLKYYDHTRDTAVLKIDGSAFDFFELSTRMVRPGERVYSIANPQGLEQSMTGGMVSGIRKDPDGTSWIQHDAAISPGSSGGALISSQGELLGISSFFIKESQGLNFAVPASTLASAYSAARLVQGALRSPGAPAVVRAAEVPPPKAPRPERSIQPEPPAPASPPPPQGDPLIQKAAKATLKLAETLQRYHCQEAVARYFSTSYVVSWQRTDLVTAEIVYDGSEEHYSNFLINGKPSKKAVVEQGVWSTGDFGQLVVDLFRPTTHAEFHFRRNSRTGGADARVYDYMVRRENSRWDVRIGSQRYAAAYRGSVWIDLDTGQALRVERAANELPEGFPADKAEASTDYEYVSIGSDKILLPVRAEFLVCQRGSDNCGRNVIDFRYGEDARLPRIGSVRLNVTVSDTSGRRITDLTQSAFTVLEDGVPQEIESFEAGEAPISEGLIIDNSANMREKNTEKEAAALALVKDSNRQDEVFIVNFNDEAFLDKDFTNDLKELQEGLARIDSRGGAAMRDAIRMSIDHLKEKAEKDKKVLVVVTAGNDNSSLISLENLVKSSLDSGVPIYAVGLLREDDRRAAKIARRALLELAEATGGEAFIAKDMADVDRAAHRVARDIRNQYTITYWPSNQAVDGSFRKLSVRVSGHHGLMARTRNGYYASGRSR